MLLFSSTWLHEIRLQWRRVAGLMLRISLLIIIFAIVVMFFYIVSWYYPLLW